MPVPTLGIYPKTIAELGELISSISFAYEALTKYFIVVS
jgi:hypothetical protein